MFRAVPILLLGAALALPVVPAHAAATNYFVSPAGNDANSGTSAARPFATIQKALDAAPRGATVHLASGTYLQDAVTVRSGVRITGPSTAVVKGAGSSRIFQVRHDGVTLDGFTIDGLYGSPDTMDGYRDKLVYVMSTSAGDGVDRLTIRNMQLRNAGGECVRLRYLITNADVHDNVVGPCGVYDFQFDDGGKNGEGIYLGTAPEQQGQNGAPDDRPDVSRNNRIHDNTIATYGNECVDVKENATENVVEHNDCSQQKDPSSGGLDARGSGNTFRYNTVHDNTGAGIRLGGDTETDGIANNIYGNTITGNAAGGIKFMRTPQGKVCGNTMSANTGGNAVGTYATTYHPTTPCP